MTIMMKQLIVATGLCALALIATPAAAQDSTRTAREHGSGSAREHGSRATVGRRLSDTPEPSRARGVARVAVGDVNGETGAQERRRRPSPNRNGIGGYYSGAAPSPEPQVQSQNNLKRVTLANH